MIDDLLPHGSRAHKRSAAEPEAAPTPPAPDPVSTAAPTPVPLEPAVPTPRVTPPHVVRRRRRRTREIVFGVVLTALAAIAITWWATSSRDPKPTFVGPTASTILGPPSSTVSNGGAPPVVTTPTPGPRTSVRAPVHAQSGGSAPQVAPQVAPDTAPAHGSPGSPSSPHAPGSTASRTTLLTTYTAMHTVFNASHSYQTISLQTLGGLLPNITIEDGSASSTNSGVVSLLTPTPNRVVLAVRDDSGCEWLRDFGSGAQLATQSGVVITCSAAAAPTTGWASAQ
ncbi:MAG TPA: hypothetical protein VGI86_19960 [Acidimicrobiia bacterium]